MMQNEMFACLYYVRQLSSMMTILVNAFPIETIGESFHFCECETSGCPPGKVDMQCIFWALRESSLYIYLSHCSNFSSFPDGECAVACVLCTLLFTFWIHITRGSAHCVMSRCICWSYRESDELQSSYCVRRGVR